MPLFFSAFGLGLIIAATPGAVTAQLLRGLGRYGFHRAFFLQLGALFGTVIWAGIAFIGTAILTQNIIVRVILSAMGILLLLMLMWQALRDAYRGKISEAKVVPIRGNFVLGAVLTLANPFPVIFWLSVLPPLLATRQAALDLTGAAIFFAGFLISTLLWSVFMSSVIAWGGRFVSPMFFRIVNLVCGLALGFFAIKLLWNALLLLNS